MAPQPFDLIVPTDLDAVDEDIHDTVVTCTSWRPEDRPRAAETGIQPGRPAACDWHPGPPPAPGEPALLVVDALEILDTALIPVLREMVLDRYGDYCVIYDADMETVPVFTVLGHWVGLADNPDTITALIDLYERANGGA
ncbi:hypothetical protein Shyd_57630 [Streptomyces hydrogenans]|uniref:Uncharacterized protein n=1 Tax=Streptomyces hydrogenans TaxID=1873719 RepID=A0ABQ3PH99_9ACTN|nr:hypothetical protein [Streptomyces hydrogenans]GHI24392.1 hypothetical protein Shyd_57630 [Streptomyces hydrogenans]